MPPCLLKMTSPVSMATLLCLSPQTESIFCSIIPAGRGPACLREGRWVLRPWHPRLPHASALLALPALPALQPG